MLITREIVTFLSMFPPFCFLNPNLANLLQAPQRLLPPGKCRYPAIPAALMRLSQSSFELGSCSLFLKRARAILSQYYRLHDFLSPRTPHLDLLLVLHRGSSVSGCFDYAAIIRLYLSFAS